MWHNFVSRWDQTGQNETRRMDAGTVSRRRENESEMLARIVMSCRGRPDTSRSVRDSLRVVWEWKYSINLPNLWFFFNQPQKWSHISYVRVSSISFTNLLLMIILDASTSRIVDSWHVLTGQAWPLNVTAYSLNANRRFRLLHYRHWLYRDLL